MSVYGHVWPYMAINGHVCPCIAMHGHAWPYMTMHGIKISFRCAKLRDNPENQGFTFFAFLPPYLGVSDSLAYTKAKNLSRSIDWYKKFLISCLVARYSAVFVLRSMEVGVGMGIVLSARSFM